MSRQEFTLNKVENRVIAREHLADFKKESVQINRPVLIFCGKMDWMVSPQST